MFADAFKFGSNLAHFSQCCIKLIFNGVERTFASRTRRRGKARSRYKSRPRPARALSSLDISRNRAEANRSIGGVSLDSPPEVNQERARRAATCSIDRPPTPLTFPHCVYTYTRACTHARTRSLPPSTPIARVRDLSSALFLFISSCIFVSNYVDLCLTENFKN